MTQFLFFSDLAEELEQRQAIVKQFAKLIEFVLIFDERKMEKHALQNDISYYRRTASKKGAQDETSTIDDVAMKTDMSFFYAEATPMLSKMTKTVEKFVGNNPKVICDMLRVIAKVCQKMMEIPELKARIQDQDTETFVVRVLVGIITLYDHINPDGAFAKGEVFFCNLLQFSVKSI